MAPEQFFPSTNLEPSRWEWVRLGYDKEILILKPEHDMPLADLLIKFKEEKRREYGARKQELLELLELVRHRQPICGRAQHYAYLFSKNHENLSLDSHMLWLWRNSLEQERIKLDMDFGQGGYKSGYLQWTPDDARRHHHIRDPFLQTRWANENGLDLQAMADQRKQIAAWTGLGDFVEAREKPLRELLGKSFERCAPYPHTLNSAQDDDLKFGASIRFRVTFANEGQQAWLAQ